MPQLKPRTPLGSWAWSRSDSGAEALRRFCDWVALRMVRRPGLNTAIGLLVVALLGAAYFGLHPSWRLADEVPDQERDRATEVGQRRQEPGDGHDHKKETSAFAGPAMPSDHPRGQVGDPY